MPEKPRVAVLSGFGINCETETMAVFDMAGASSDRVHVNRLVNGEQSLSDYDIMAIPNIYNTLHHINDVIPVTYTHLTLPTKRIV